MTVVWTPTLYPDPLLPMLTAVIEPAAETVAVPPAATKGWYAKPPTEPTDRILPPDG